MRIERGTVIADRYVVSAIERPWLADTAGAGVVCLALDAILDAPVILYAADAELAGDLLDAGRRLALVNDPRVPSVLDVGSADIEDDRTIVYVVCERTAATSLAEVLSSGPIDPDEARAVTGEVSEVLVHAGRRGLHHRCLGPESIGIMANGDVVVHGIAIDAALSEVALGLEVQTDTTALREDALAIVDVLYACLSGQWPKPESRAGLPAAPRKNQRVVEIEKLRSDVPEDLAAFLTGVTSFSDPGPRSPGEIVRYLREWERDSLANLEGSPLPDEELFSEDGGGDVAVDDAAAATTGVSSTAADAPGTEAPGAAPASDPLSSAADADESDQPAGASDAAATPADGAAAASTSAGAGTVGAKPTGNLSTAAKAGKKAGGRGGSTIGMGSTGSRPTTAQSPRPAAPTAPPQRQATPDQIQAALARIGMNRPGTSGYSAGRSDGVVTKLDEQMQMREASVFPLTADDLAAVDTEEWTPEQTYSAYEDLSATEYDSNVTAPILDRDALWSEAEDVTTQSMPVIPDLSEEAAEAPAAADAGADAAAGSDGDSEADAGAGAEAEADAISTAVDDERVAGTRETDGAADDEPAEDEPAEDDGSWFLGGVFTTREEEVEQQRIAFERERALERGRAEAARRRVRDAEARQSRQRDASQRETSQRETARSAAAHSSMIGTATRAGTATAGERPTGDRPADGTSGGGRPTAGAGGPAGEVTSTKGASGRSGSGTSGAAAVGAGTSGAATAGAGTSGAAAAGSVSAAGGGPSGGGAGGGAAGGGSSTSSGPSAARRRRTVTLLVLALLVIAAIVIGILTLGGTSDETAAPEPEPAQETTSAPAETEEPEPEAAAPVIDSITAIDPEGDDEENSDEAELVMPGESGGWRSERYSTPDFGGLKSGVGLLVELEEEAEITQLDFLAPDGTSVLEVRVGDSDDVEDAQTVEEVDLDGDVTVELDEPAIGQYVFLWFTEATAEGGGYRAMIDEVDIG